MDTLCIHQRSQRTTDDEIDPWLDGVVSPIYLSNGERPIKNPTRQSLEQCLTSLDNAKQPTLTFASGMAAISTVCLTLLKKDDHAIIVDDAYSGTIRLFQKYLPRWSIQSTFVNLSKSYSVVSDHLNPKTRIVWIESPSNPSLRLVDIKEVSSLVHNYNSSIIVVVDNTFASPFNQSPLELGVDICFASLTKYLNGHSDVIGGCLSVNRKDLYEQLLAKRSLFGMQFSPFDCYAVRRGINTFVVRMRQLMKNAHRVALFLEEHPVIRCVYYPSLKSHPQHEIYLKQGGASSMCSFVLIENADVRQFLCALKLCTVAVSLGGHETLIESPAIMTHRSTVSSNGADDEMSVKLIRMSVGLENAQDIMNDLNQALYESIKENPIDIDCDLELIQIAKSVCHRLNKFDLQPTATALRTTSGQIYSGISFQTICSEMSAISSMANDGHQDLSSMVTIRGYNDDKDRFEIISPCEKCQEIIKNFNSNIRIILNEKKTN